MPLLQEHFGRHDRRRASEYRQRLCYEYQHFKTMRRRPARYMAAESLTAIYLSFSQAALIQRAPRLLRCLAARPSLTFTDGAPEGAARAE